ncbi:MAG: MGMT family protein [Bacteroidales bacterium]
MSDNDFFKMVFDVTRKIPPGRVTSYGAIARYLGSSQSSRMVGWALNTSHNQEIFVPAHRVVNRYGMLTGKHHFRHEELMQELLENEGVRVINDCVVDFKAYFWDPNKELV